MPKKTDSPLYRPDTAFDLLRLPVIGRLLKARQGRLLLQVPLLIIAGLIIYDGFTGPQSASRNLATVASWVHYRGFVVLAILLAGNLFCMGCPFTIPRTLARRFAIKGGRFPAALRNKWLAIAGLFGIFFVYEWLDLWASPLLTAWVIIAYFVASFALEFAFAESPFCKYVCPLGSFNFVHSTASPTQIAIKDENACANCQGKECINGSWSAEPTVRIDQIPVVQNGETRTEAREVRRDTSGVLGCGTELFPPQLKSNMDCVYCLDCVRACPHDNIGLFVRTPGRELLQKNAWSKRWDFSLFIIILAFMGITNAFGMVPPVYALQERIVEASGIRSEFVILLGLFLTGNIILPVAATVFTAWLTRLFTSSAHSLRDNVATFAPAFVPLGFGIWIAHYGFHFLVAPLSIIPVIQEFLGMTGEWATYAAGVDSPIISFIQVVALVGGFLWSMVIAQKRAVRTYRRDGVLALLPWALLLLILMMLAIQVFSLPMEMRGTDMIFN